MQKPCDLIDSPKCFILPMYHENKVTESVEGWLAIFLEVKFNLYCRVLKGVVSKGRG